MNRQDARVARVARRRWGGVPGVLAVQVSFLFATESRAADEPTIATFPIAFAVMQKDDGEPVREDAWLDEQLAHADDLFGPDGVHFKKTSRRLVGSMYAALETRGDRDALRLQTRPGVINVFVVASLRDVDEKERFRFGVHWRPSQDPKSRYVILAAGAPPSVLAHELGHYFGNPHSPTPNNIMSYTRTGAPPFFDDAQLAKIRVTARRCLQERELLPVPPAAR